MVVDCIYNTIAGQYFLLDLLNSSSADTVFLLHNSLYAFGIYKNVQLKDSFLLKLEQN